MTNHRVLSWDSVVALSEFRITAGMPGPFYTRMDHCFADGTEIASGIVALYGCSGRKIIAGCMVIMMNF